MSLTERLQHFHEVIAWKGEIPLQSRYSVGLAGTRFFEEIRDNARLMGTYCPSCDYTYLPPHIYCERCMAELTEWVEVPNRGAVYSYTILHVSLDEEPMQAPLVIAFVRMVGTDGGLIHLLEADPDEIYIGMPVEAVFKEERTGSLHDIEYFKPV